MSPNVRLSFHRRTRSRFHAVMVGIAILSQTLPANGARIDTHDADPHGMISAHRQAMSESHAKALVKSWFASHQLVGESSSDTPVDTFRVEGFQFNANHSVFTPIDTVRILVGQTVLWLWQSGTHTVTSGSGSADPSAGVLFDREISSVAPEFAFSFSEPGVVPFFCRPHESLDMKGVVIVEANTGIEVVDDGPRGIGFARGPWPNPTRGETRFQLGVQETGRVRLDLFDVRGRMVATILDQALAPGGYVVRWNGLSRDGRPVEPGVYYAKLRWPGHAQSLRLIVMR